MQLPVRGINPRTVELRQTAISIVIEKSLKC